MEDISRSYVLALFGCGMWLYVLGCYIGVRLQRIWLRNKMDIQWIEKKKKRRKLSTLEITARMEKLIRIMRKLRNIHMGIIVWSSTFLILDFLIYESAKYPAERLAEHIQGTILDELILAGILIPGWFVYTVVIMLTDDKRKRIIEIMKNWGT